MVEDTGAQVRPGEIRPLNEPVAVRVQADDSGRPLRVSSGRRWHRVVAVVETWAVEEEWWSPRPVAREYHRLELADGRGLVIFRDLQTGRWFRQRA